MELLSKFNFKPNPLLLSNNLNNININKNNSPLISFSKPSFPSLKIKASSSHYTNPKPSLNPNKTLISLIKTSLTVAVAATAIALSAFSHKPLPARAEPVATESEELPASVSDEEREKKLEEYVLAHGDDVQGYKALMEVKIKNKKLSEAVVMLNKLIELEPGETEWRLLRAHLYSYMGETELAKAGFEDILAKDPIRVEAFHGLVMAVSQGEESNDELRVILDRISSAVEKCKKAKKKDELRDFKLLIAQVRVIEGNYDEALKVYKELVKEEPRDFRPYLCQGIIYTLLRKKDDAEKQFEKYKRLVPQGHPYAQYFDDNMLATKVFSQMAENERSKMSSKS